MDSNTAMAEAQAAPTTVRELVLSLEQATLMAKQLPATADPTHLLQIYSALHQAHRHLSSFLSTAQIPIPPPPPPAPAASENSLSSATADYGGSEPMQVGDEDGPEAEENSKTSIDKVEERMRECFIRNKRAKRPPSPSSTAALEERRDGGNGSLADAKGFDPHSEKLRALDLIYQFHG